MKKAITVLFLWITLSSCNTKQEPISFMLLEKHTGKSTTGYGDNGYIYIYVETYLVDNLPEYKRSKKKGIYIDDSVYNIESEFFKSNNKICLLEDDISEYSMAIYRESMCTKHFIENFQDHTGLFQTTFEDCADDGTYGFYYERDKGDPNMWTNPVVALYWDKKYRDTIYCDPNRKTMKLPDMPRPQRNANKIQGSAQSDSTLWDHFGLDDDDMEKVFNIIPSVGETFVCWFILQHLRGYKPFVTKVTFEKAFKGNINEGREERLAQRKVLEKKKKMEKLRRIGRKKPGEM